jgi:hypothetical protein
MGATTACTCRITETVCQTSSDGVCEVLLGDAWFGSVKTATETALRQKEGIFQVKIARKLYPRDEIQAMLKGKSGGCQVTLKVAKLVALGYKYNQKSTLFFIFTENVGSATPGCPYEMKFADVNGNIFMRYVDRPEVVSKFYDASNIIDVLNHLRQSSLAIEKKWVTHSGYFRIHTSLIGINVEGVLMLSISSQST